MEETNVASGTTTSNSEQVQARVNALNALFDDIETRFRPTLDRVSERQTTDTWTDIPACADFRLQMRQTLTEAERTLGQLWRKVGDLCTNLQESAAALEEIDATTSANLAALVDRANEGMPDPAVPPTRPGDNTTPWMPPTSTRPDSGPLVLGDGLLTDVPSGSSSS